MTLHVSHIISGCYMSTTASAGPTVECIGAVTEHQTRYLLVVKPLFQFTNGLGQAAQTKCATTRPRSGWVLGQEQILHGCYWNI